MPNDSRSGEPVTPNRAADGGEETPKTTSLMQIAANKANALKSTGPNTPEGRAVSKMNAFKHGIFSKEVLERILRYETTLQRQLYRAMSQLERLQRMRQGEAVPAPMVMEVSEKAITYKGIFAKRTQIEKVPSGS